MEERVAEHGDEVAPAAARTQQRAQQQQVWQRVQVEVRVVEVAADVDLDGEAQVAQPVGLVEERV